VEFDYSDDFCSHPVRGARGCVAIDGRAVVIAVVACLASVMFDRWAYEHLTFASVYEHDWGRLLRVVGYWPTWCVAALALWLNDGTAPARRRAVLLLTSPTVAGIAAEAFKLVLRRERPEARHGAYALRAFTDRPFSSAGIGSPSSHAAVAFGGTAILACLFPRARWVWFALAVGCALTRVLARAHFLSDVVGGAILGLAAAAWLYRRYARAHTRTLDDA
jgi:membrane-associated phospholipid phosphatase